MSYLKHGNLHTGKRHSLCWDGAQVAKNSSSRKTSTCLSYIINTMAADVLRRKEPRHQQPSYRPNIPEYSGLSTRKAKSMGECKKDVKSPLLTHWSYVFLALTHRSDLWVEHDLRLCLTGFSSNLGTLFQLCVICDFSWPCCFHRMLLDVKFYVFVYCNGLVQERHNFAWMYWCQIFLCIASQIIVNLPWQTTASKTLDQLYSLLDFFCVCALIGKKMRHFSQLSVDYLPYIAL